MAPHDARAPTPEGPADLDVRGEVIEWRGPSPFHFVVATGEEAEWLTEIMRDVTYGWGMIPVRGQIGATGFTTSLWPRRGSFYVPIKDAVRRAEQIELGDLITVDLWIGR